MMHTHGHTHTHGTRMDAHACVTHMRHTHMMHTLDMHTHVTHMDAFCIAQRASYCTRACVLPKSSWIPRALFNMPLPPRCQLVVHQHAQVSTQEIRDQGDVRAQVAIHEGDARAQEQSYGPRAFVLLKSICLLKRRYGFLTARARAKVHAYAQ